MLKRRQKIFIKKCGQTFLEYTIVIGVVVLILDDDADDEARHSGDD